MNATSSKDEKLSSIDVLVVDDDADTVEELVEFLSKAGLMCRSATDGWDALKQLADGGKAIRAADRCAQGQVVGEIERQRGLRREMMLVYAG